MTGLPAEITAKYEVLAMMGEGGMGSVYKVRHRFLDDIRVIKLMQAKFQKNEELKARFLREARTAAQLPHKNIAEVKDFSVAADGTAYIVMEYIDGIDMREVLRRTGGPLDYKLVIDLSLQTLAALAFLHKKGFVHRDISPDNLMLTRDSQGKPLIKLIDLGIAKSVEGTMNLTNDGRFIGKVQYASPEQFGGVDGRAVVDSRSDLYSFGIVMYELLTNTEPILGTDARAIMAGHLTRKPRSFEETDPKNRVPLPLREIVFVALEKEREDRFQSADAFADALRSVLAPPVTLVQQNLRDDRTVDEQQAWEEAVRTNTVRGWEHFLELCGSSRRAEEARERLEALEELEESDWNQASILETVEMWRTYLARHGDSSRASKARRRLEKLEQRASEELAWSLAEKAGTITAWEDYLRKHERSSRATDARLRLAALREQIAEEQSWNDAELVDSSSGWATYLDRHPASTRVTAAQDRYRKAVARELDDRDWDAATNIATSLAWSDYLEKHPDSARAALARKYRQEAEEREHERQGWETALLADTSAAWGEYLARFGSSPRAANAKERQDRARRREQAALEEEARIRAEREEEAAWATSLAAASGAAWEAYLQSFPASRRRADAERHLAQIRKKEQSEQEWRNVIASPTAAALEAFVSRHPESVHLSDARRRLDEFREEERLRASEEAKRREQEAEERDWLDARTRDSIKRWEAFVAAHPASPRAAEARTRIEALVRKGLEEEDARKRREQETREREAELRRQKEEEAKRKREEKEREEAERKGALRRKREAEELRKREEALAAQRAAAEKREREEAEKNEREAALRRQREEEERRRETDRQARLRDLEALRQEEMRALPRTTIEVPQTSIEPSVTVRQMIPATVSQTFVGEVHEAPDAPKTVVMSLPASEPERKSRRALTITLATAALLAVVVIGVLVKDRLTSVEPITTTITETIEKPPVPAVVAGQLAIDASPWGQIESVTDAQGREFLPAKPSYTPLLLSLPAGTYSVRMTNPNSRASRTLSAEVQPQMLASCVAQLDQVTADEYLEKIGLENK